MMRFVRVGHARRNLWLARSMVALLGMLSRNNMLTWHGLDCCRISGMVHS